jgi:hypothetical protein
MKIKKKMSILVLVLVFGIVQLIAGNPNQEIRVKSYELDVTFIPKKHAMKGKAIIRFIPNSVKKEKLVFYLHGELSVDSLEIEGEKIPYSSNLVFYPGDYSGVAQKVEAPMEKIDLSKELTVVYSGYFNASRARSLSDYMRIDQDGVLLRAYGYSLWFPMFLESNQDWYSVSFPKVTIRTPADFTSVFVGTRVRDYLERDTRISQWRADNVELIYPQCTAQRYTVLKEDGYHVYSYNDSHSQEIAKKVLTYARKLESLYKKYYKKSASASQLHVMQMPEYGDIASGNVVGMCEESWRKFKENSYEGWTLAHELVHSFVRVPTPITDPLFALVIEGFPSYFDLPVMAEIVGDEYPDKILKWTEDSYIKKRETGKDRRGRPLPPEKPLLEISDDEISDYKDNFILSDRALLFFHYLRTKMGKDRFWEFTRELFGQKALNYDILERVILKYLPGVREDIRIWLKTTEYPGRFHLKKQ